MRHLETNSGFEPGGDLVTDGLIQHHRLYWGWFGWRMLINSALKKAARG